MSIANKGRYKGAPWVIVDENLIQKFQLPGLPQELQDLKEAWERRQKVTNNLGTLLMRI